MKRLFLAALGVAAITSAKAQFDEPILADTVKARALKNVEYKVEMQGSVSGNKTPLWLNANRYGLSSLEKTNGYIRGAVERILNTDEGRKWGLGYGLDLVAPFNYTSKVVIQQAYVEGRWLHGVLSVGAKEYPMELKNNELSTGSQTLGINARPVPQVRLALKDYWTIPHTKGWLHLKGHIAYGKMTDENWQHDFTMKQSKYADGVLYHSKAGYLKLGNREVFSPWSLEMGLEMVSTFGGTSYTFLPDGSSIVKEGEKGVKTFWRAFIPGGGDVGETTYQNAEGNQLGSWVMRLEYDGDLNRYALYADKYFEDHSSMLFLDYDGYGVGDEWQVKKDNKYVRYDIKDWLLGFEYNFKADSWLNTVVLEYMYSKYQSGPIYHDHTKTIAEHLGGKDDFYNHYIYTGNQHWGQAMGNPLYRSPIYNEDGKIRFANNRFSAYHIGLGGKPNQFVKWRFLCTWQDGLGTYAEPYIKVKHNASLLGEVEYEFHPDKKNWLTNSTLRGACGADFGSILGGVNYGFQLTFCKRGVF